MIRFSKTIDTLRMECLLGGTQDDRVTIHVGEKGWFILNGIEQVRDLQHLLERARHFMESASRSQRADALSEEMRSRNLEAA